MSEVQPGVYCYIQADTNDADYVAELRLIEADDAELLERFANVLLTKQDERYNFYAKWDDLNRHPDHYAMYPEFTEYEWETLFNYIPSGGETGIHSITQFKVFGVIGGNDMLNGDK